MAIGLAAVALGGCGSQPTGPGGAPTAPVIASVVVSPVMDTVFVGGSVQLTALARTAAGDTVRTATFTWRSEDTTIAEVSTAGLVVARRTGSVLVTATSGTRSGHATIAVRAALAPTIHAISPASAAVGGPDLLLTITGTGFLTDVRLQWNGTARPTQYVSDSVVRATIWAGDLTQVGDAEVRLVNAVPGGGASQAVAFPIVPQAVPVASIELSQAVAYTPGAAVPLSVIVRDSAGNVLTGRLVTWTSSNWLVASVTASGIVQPRGVGEATIAAQSEGQTGTLALTVDTRPIHLILEDGTSGLSVLDMRLGGVPFTFWQSGAGTAGDPSVSPDGRWIAHTVQLGTTRAVAVMDQATRTYRFLTNDGWSDQPAWSPVGGRIAFRSHRAGRADVWMMNEDGTGAVNLTATMPAGWQAGWPAWSPDGGRIVFSAGASASSLSLYLMNADGTGIQPLLLSPDLDTEATWFGSAVVFTRRASDGATDLFRLPIGGGPVLRLTHTGQASAPAWSPDGRWIAFANGAEQGGRYDILAVRPFAEEVRPLSLVSRGGGGRSPTWLVHR